VNRHVDAGEQRAEARRGGLGDEQFAGRAEAQRSLDEVGSLGDETAGTPTADAAVQLRRSGYP
jgi:hypothetical protein